MGRRTTSTRSRSLNGAKPVPLGRRRKSIPLLFGAVGLGCLVALLLSRRGKLGSAGELMHEGMDQLHDAVQAARQKMRDARNASYPKTQTLVSNMGAGIRRWMDR